MTRPRERLRGLIHEHHFDDLHVVISTDHRAEDAGDRKGDIAAGNRRSEHEQLGPEAEEWWNPGQAPHERAECPGEGGPRLGEAGQAGDGLDRAALLIAHPQNAQEGAQGHDDIDSHVKQHRRRPASAACRKADQGESDIIDRRVSEQPLDVGLTVSRDGAEKDRGQGGEYHDLAPGVGRRS